jgi:4-amino-4-deoxy-L-arabinose transferase-like glycosyltransferase
VNLTKIRWDGLLAGTLVTLVLMRMATLGLYPLLDTTEARYGEMARKMVELNDWVTLWFDYGVPYWGKPPLSFWMTAGSFKLFGINEFTARLPHFLDALLIGWIVWSWTAHRSRLEASYSAILLAGSIGFFVAAGAVMTDMTLVLGITLTMRGFWLGLYGKDMERKRESWLLFLGLAIGLLAKGPLVLVLAGLPLLVWTFATGNAGIVLRKLPWVRGSLLTIGLTVPWYVLAEQHTPGFLDYFIVGEHWHRFIESGWNGDLYGHAHAIPRGSVWLFTLAASLPWCVLLPVSAICWRKSIKMKLQDTHSDRSWLLFLLFWGLMPCVFFTFTKNIIWPYVLPGFPALAMLGATWISGFPDTVRVNRVLIVGLVFTMTMFTLFLLFDNHDIRSQRSLVADYENRHVEHAPLIFFRLQTFSGTFYSEGKSLVARDAKQLTNQLDHGPAFVAIKPRDFQTLPAVVQQKLTFLASHGEYQLFFEK